MKALICGATGFVGRHLEAALAAQGHQTVRGVRRPSLPTDIAVDYDKDVSPELWLPKLDGFDVVINAVGLLRDTATQSMEVVQHLAPCALFKACVQLGIPRIVQISALGVEGGLDTAYFRTRRAAEACLHALPETTHWLILRPSLIYGGDGTSARMFRKQASLPVHVLPMDGSQPVQPVHIDDIVDAVINWLDKPDTPSLCVTAAGADSTTLKGMLDSYRSQQGFPPAIHINIPGGMVRLAAKIGDHVSASPLCSDTLAMLRAGNTGDTAAFAKLLGRQPRSYKNFIERGSRHGDD